MDDASTRTSGLSATRGQRPARPGRPQGPTGNETDRRTAGRPPQQPPSVPIASPPRSAPPRPPAPARRADSLLEATGPLRGRLPRQAELPTRRLPRTVEPSDDPPTETITPARTITRAVPIAAPVRPLAERPSDEPDAGASTGEPAVSWPRRRVQRTTPQRRGDQRTLQRALLAAGAATFAPGAGHLLLGRRRSGAALLGLFVFCLVALLVLATTLPRAQLLENLLSTRVLIVGAIGCLGVAAAWMGVIVHTYLIGRPARLRTGQRVLGAATVTALCLVVAAPLGLAAHLANSQRSLLDTLFPSAGAASAAAIGKPRLNILLIGSDAGPDRTGTRTDTMMVASVETRTGRTTLFGLPRNIGFARFPPGSPMAAEFPDGFHDNADPLSGNYLLNAVYAYGHSFPQLAPKGPTRDPGLNLLQSSISYMLGLPVDYQIVVNMAGFATIIDALGGLRVDVGPERITIGGIGPHGEKIKPEGYIEPGMQELTGKQALAFARARTGSSDYVRMGRQRCLIQYVLDQKSPTDLLTNFQAVARATTDSVSTTIPREVLPALVSLAGGSGAVQLESVAFDPNLPDPSTDDGHFNTFHPNVAYMREVVRESINRPPAAAGPTSSATRSTGRDDTAGGVPPSPADRTKAPTPGAAEEPAVTAAPQPLAQSC